MLHPLAGDLLLYGVGARDRHLMGFAEDRSANLRMRDRCHIPDYGLT